MPKPKLTKIPFQLHPRVFAALGSDLVTNDLVAVTELVKNSYDAFATRVDVRFGIDDEHGEYLEIEDNGLGMDRDTIQSVWCVVATPNRARNPVTKFKGKTRRVAGEKGLGRLSMARLGDGLRMLTQVPKGECVQLDIGWQQLSEASSLASCAVSIQEFGGESPFRVSGTVLRIYDLKAEWDEERLKELHEHLSRLLSPFSGVDDFEIWLHQKGENAEAARIAAPDFLNHPKYCLKGSFAEDGTLKATYEFRPSERGKKGRQKSVSVRWQTIRDQLKVSALKRLVAPACGPFEFEVRAWDIGSDELDEISERYEIKKAHIRGAIRAHKGISVYRDGILVLPKSEATRDWLGLDIRRVSYIGDRLSTSQIVAYVSITAENNPQIKDTSDRERLVDNTEVAVFEELIKAAVEVLERERRADRVPKETAERPFKDLLGTLSADQLLDQVKAVADSEAPVRAALPLVVEHEKKLKEAREEIERRFVYYSRLATIGTLAQMLVHEVRNKTTVVGGFLQAVSRSDAVENFPVKLRERLDRAINAVSGLDRLAETFAPLASRSFARDRRTSVLEDRIAGTLALKESDYERLKIKVKFGAKGSTPVAVDPGELDAILVNLVDNAIYWLEQVPKDDRQLEIRVTRDKHNTRVRVGIHDSGPGVREEDADRVFLPGVTNKPGGIGMGLTIASEIVAVHDGEMALIQPGELGGASFQFDLPIKSK